MRRNLAAIGSTVFFALAPGTVAGLVPWWLTGWRLREPLAHWAPVRVLGILLTVAGAVVVVHAFIRFVVEGAGTPAPVAPTTYLMVTLKIELVYRRSWRTRDEAENAIFACIDGWFNHRRLHGTCGNLPPAEYEAIHYRHQ